MASSLETWALPRIQQLLPLDEESLKQILAYSESLPKDAAAEHLKNLLGDDAKCLEFISSFNMRRQTAPPSAAFAQSRSQAAAPSSSSASGTPRRPRQAKKKANIHALPARQVEGQGNTGGAYQKRNEGEHIPTRPKHKYQVAENLTLRPRKPDATQMPLITDDASLTTQPITSKAPPSAVGPLISDSLSPDRGGSKATSRTASPAPKAKINISGGTAMHGASTALSDLDSAIRSLELQTNPSLSATSPADNEKRRCNCMATRHPLLDMAPNCMACGKIVCVKEGLGPCTFCGAQIMSAEDLHKVLRVLKDERGDERMKANNAAQKRPDVASGKPRAYTGRDFLAQVSARPSPLSSNAATPASSDDEAGDKAKAHRDRLLNFQANNARRTQIHDEAADYDVPSAGTSMWASPQERAQQLKKQQKILREIEWNARPEYEKRKVVASIDLKGGKVVRKMAEVERPAFGAGEDDVNVKESSRPPATMSTNGGAFSNNPLAAGLIRPVARVSKGKDATRQETTTWRRVQMDGDENDNEQWILDGGVHGGQAVDRPLGQEEHSFG